MTSVFELQRGARKTRGCVSVRVCVHFLCSFFSPKPRPPAPSTRPSANSCCPPSSAGPRLDKTWLRPGSARHNRSSSSSSSAQPRHFWIIAEYQPAPLLTIRDNLHSTVHWVRLLFCRPILQPCLVLSRVCLSVCGMNRRAAKRWHLNPPGRHSDTARTRLGSDLVFSV